MLMFVTNVYAEMKISPIFDGEVNMDDKSCWLEDHKEIVFFYSNSKEAYIKLDEKLLSLEQKKSTKLPDDKCKKSYVYNSKDKKTSVRIEMVKNKSNKCTAKMLVTSEKRKAALDGLKMSCD